MSNINKTENDNELVITYPGYSPRQFTTLRKVGDTLYLNHTYNINGNETNSIKETCKITDGEWDDLLHHVNIECTVGGLIKPFSERRIVLFAEYKECIFNGVERPRHYILHP